MINILPTITLNTIEQYGSNRLFADWRFYFSLMMTGLFTGLGSSIGNYFANKHLIENVERLRKRENDRIDK